MRVYHQSYGEGIVINRVNDICTVKFDNGITKDVSFSELAEVLHS